MREKRNCHNVKDFSESILMKEDWHTFSPKHMHVLKFGDLKFYECPVSCLTSKTWEILGLVNNTTNGDGDILHLPFEGSYLKQPSWYREAVSIVRRERAQKRKDDIEKRKR